MTRGEEPRRAPVGGPPWPALPPDAAGTPRPDGLAVLALVLAVVSLLVPVLPGLAALMLAAVAARRARALPAGTAGGRGLVAAASALAAVSVLAWVGLGALVITQRQEPTGWPAATTAQEAGTGPFSQVTVPPATESLPTEPAMTEPATTGPPAAKPRVAVVSIGDRVTVSDESGFAQFEVTVTKVKFSAGDEFQRPESGLFMGAYVQVRALADGQDTVSAAEMSALVGGYVHPVVVSVLDAFDPPLDYVLLDTGQEAAGWLVFDVPARHGRLVLRDILDGHELAVWKY